MDRAPESLIGEMSVMDGSGHRQVTWNRDNPVEIAAAKAVFNDLIARGYSAFGAKTKAAPRHATPVFDPDAAALVMVPRIVGG